MPDTLTHLWSKSARQMARDLARDAADGLKDEANRAVIEAESLVSMLRSAGAGRLSILALQDALSDCFGDVQGAINQGLDDAGIAEEGYQIDISDVVA